MPSNLGWPTLQKTRTRICLILYGADMETLSSSLRDCCSAVQCRRLRFVGQTSTRFNSDVSDASRAFNLGLVHIVR